MGEIMLNEAELLLKRLGLTEYESKAYMVVLKTGSCSADCISRLGNIPLPRVYDTMQALASKGLISVTKTRPQKFKAVEPKHIFDLIIDDGRNKLEEKEKDIENVKKEFLKKVNTIGKMSNDNEDKEVVTYTKRRTKMEKIREDFINKGKKEVLLFSGDLSWIDKTYDVSHKILKRKIDIKILWNSKKKETDQILQKFIRKQPDLKSKFRYSSKFGKLRAIIVDGDEVSIAEKGAPGKTYTAITINNKLLVSVFRNYFYELWNSAIPVEKYLKQ